MRTIPHRELRNNSSKVLSDVQAGETIAVTNKGEVAAILVPPSSSRWEQLIASGGILPASRPGHAREIIRAQSELTVTEVLDDLKGER